MYIWLVTDPFPPPTNVHLTSVNSSRLTFAWDDIELSCPMLQYQINATGCGTCPATTTANGIDCVDFSVTSSQLCTFTVSTVICSDIASVTNTTVQVTLRGRYIMSIICNNM